MDRRSRGNLSSASDIYERMCTQTLTEIMYCDVKKMLQMNSNVYVFNNNSYMLYWHVERWMGRWFEMISRFWKTPANIKGLQQHSAVELLIKYLIQALINLFKSYFWVCECTAAQTKACLCLCAAWYKNGYNISPTPCPRVFARTEEHAL